jgi:hypothetical protein
MREVDQRYAKLDHGKKVNRSQASVLAKTAGAHRGVEPLPGSPPSPAARPANAPAAALDDDEA